MMQNATNTWTYYDATSPLWMNPQWNLMFNIFSWGWWLIAIVATALIFEKAGEKWWKAVIPFYHEWTETQVGKSPSSWFWMWLGFGLGGGVIMSIGFVMFVIAVLSFNPGGMAGLILVGFLLLFIGLALLIVSVVFYGRILHGISTSFGKGLGFTFGLLFLSPIFRMILALDDSIYQPVVPAVGAAGSGSYPTGYPAGAGVPAGMQPFGQQAQASPHQPQMQPQQYNAFGQPQTQQPAPYGQNATYGQQDTQQAQPATRYCPQTGQPMAQQPVGQASTVGAAGAFPAPVSTTDSGRLSRGTVVGYVLLILVPIIACCIIASYLSDLANYATMNPYGFMW
ncbi:MAG: DUF5684 domain-containing protein [Coriobacteriia bacterium]|nr:DUF5684 domain-containing protein [Coriobacteriia bacterium]